MREVADGTAHKEEGEGEGEKLCLFFSCLHITSITARVIDITCMIVACNMDISLADEKNSLVACAEKGVERKVILCLLASSCWPQGIVLFGERKFFESECREKSQYNFHKEALQQFSFCYCGVCVRVRVDVRCALSLSLPLFSLPA